MAFTPGSLPIPLPHPMAGVTSAAFDGSGSYLIGGHRVFTGNDASFDLEPLSPETEVLRTIAHPAQPLVARVTRKDARLELVDLRTQTRKRVEGIATDVAFSPSGKLLAAVRPESNQVRLIDLEGRQTDTLEFPRSKVSTNAPAVCFSADGEAVIVFPDHNTRVVLPLAGGAATTTALPPVKFSQWTQNRALAVGPDVFLFDCNAWRLIRADGSVGWTGKGDHEGVALVPGGIALIRAVKRVILFLDPATGKELASLKIKPTFAPLGFACSSTQAAYAAKGGLELVDLPAEVLGGARAAPSAKARPAAKPKGKVAKKS